MIRWAKVRTSAEVSIDALVPIRAAWSRPSTAYLEANSYPGPALEDREVTERVGQRTVVAVVQAQVLII